VGRVWPRHGHRGRPLNKIVRKHSEMTGQVHEASRGSTFGAISGIVMVIVALFISIPVAANLPESWPGVVVAFVVGTIG
jgi:hypothetical protein